MAIVVLEHVLDETASVYRITFGTEVTYEVPAPPDPEAESADDDEQGVEIRTRYENVETVVFAADDERWLTDDGERRPLDEVAADQRAIVREAFDERAREAEQRVLAEEAATHELPGVGEAL